VPDAAPQTWVLTGSPDALVLVERRREPARVRA
jgi:hypothetical protein